ncbi:MAG: DNA cytosine methyltransferase, partial [Prevotella sp.]|nr:DNA cytosine methyltransferase [Prevotella sp.]
IAECIDWTNPGTSIFDREKPLCEKTIQRIAKGFKKFVLDEPDPYMVDNKYLPYLIQYHSEVRDGEVRGQKVTDPIMTLDTSNRYALIMPYIVTLRNNMVGQSVREPLGTITAGGGHHMAVYAYLIKYYGSIQACSVAEPLDTITTKDRFALVTVQEEDYAVADIFMRFLTPRELFNATGFPEDYIIDHDCDGNAYTRAKQVARCGNAVTPPVATALVRANLPEYCK